MERVTISIDDDLLAQFDRFIDSKGYANRSEGVRDAIRALLSEERVAADKDEMCVGCVVYVYNHRERSLSSRLVETQHAHGDTRAATLHLHLDHDHCLEATVVNGTVGDVRKMADEMTSQVGVKHGHLHVIPLDSGD